MFVEIVREHIEHNERSAAHVGAHAHTHTHTHVRSKNSTLYMSALIESGTCLRMSLKLMGLIMADKAVSCLVLHSLVL